MSRAATTWKYHWVPLVPTDHTGTIHACCRSGRSDPMVGSGAVWCFVAVESAFTFGAILLSVLLQASWLRWWTKKQDRQVNSSDWTGTIRTSSSSLERSAHFRCSAKVPGRLSNWTTCSDALTVNAPTFSTMVFSRLSISEPGQGLPGPAPLCSGETSVRRTVWKPSKSR